MSDYIDDLTVLLGMTMVFFIIVLVCVLVFFYFIDRKDRDE